MKQKTLFFIIAVILCYSKFIFSAPIKSNNSECHWAGFYLGVNSGYWWAQNNKVATTGSPGFVNQTFALGASNIANALAQTATNTFSFHSDGLIGGGQVGYNYPYTKEVLLGLDIDFEGLSHSNNTHSLQKTVNLIDFDENYLGSLVVKEKINYLGTVRARLGYLYVPAFLVYVTGGFAYGHVTLDTAWSVQESLGPTVFPGIIAQNNVSKVRFGWTAGVGVEWLFKSNWSAKIEYAYYDLNDLNAPVTLAQINSSLSPSVPWGNAEANTKLSISTGTIRAGINYHFS